MTELSASQTTVPWSVSGDKAAKLTRLYRAQVLDCEPVPTEPEEGAKAKARRPRRPSRTGFRVVGVHIGRT